MAKRHTADRSVVGFCWLGASKGGIGDKHTSGVREQNPVGDLGDKVPQKLTMFCEY